MFGDSQKNRAPSQQPRLGTAVTSTWSWKAGLHSLPARISLIVLITAAITSLTVTMLSVASMDSFLRAKIDRKFPTILSSVREKMELWYDQRELEINVFKSSSVVVDNVDRIASGVRSTRRKQARAEIETYLRSVIEISPQYGALFVLDGEGTVLASAGQTVSLTPGDREKMRERTSRASFEPIYTLGSHRQVASGAIHRSDGTQLGSVHSLLRTETMGSLLHSDDLGATGSIYVVTDAGAVALGSPAVKASGKIRAHASGSPASPWVEYDTANRERMVSAALPIGRFGWTVVVEEGYAEAFEPSVNAVQRIIGINFAIVVVLCAGAFAMALSISRPIRALAGAAERISDGERDVLIPAIDTQDEVGMLARALESMVDRLSENHREIKRSHQEVEAANRDLMTEKGELQRANAILEKLSITDGLTKLHNHRFFQDQLVREAKRADRTGKPLTLVLIDIDHFKCWNDRLGHASGDEILRKLAACLNETIRETDLLARYGGEEFVLLLSNTDLEGARALAEKARQRVSETRFFMNPPSEDEAVTISAGVAAYSGDRKAFFVAADEALYRAKNGGRDCVFVDGE